MSRLLRPLDPARWPKWFLVGVWGPVLSVFVGACFAASVEHYPGGYDWRYEVVCRPGYEWVNPLGSVWWSASLAGICVAALPCGVYFHARLRGAAPRLSFAARGALLAGLVAGLIVAMDGVAFPRLNTLVPKLHEVTATLTFGLIFFGVAGFWAALVIWLSRVRRWSVLGCGLLSLSVVVPFTGAMLSQAYLFFVPNNLGWVGADWAEKDVPLYLSFAFWEWVAIGGIYVSLYVMAFLLPSEPDPGAA
jgi:hypothetical protein